MSLSASRNMTHRELRELIGPDGQIKQVNEVLERSYAGIIDDMNWVMGNHPNGHEAAQRIGLPSVQYGSINKGVVASKGNTQTVLDMCAKLESLSEQAKNLIDASPNPAQARFVADAAHIQAMTNKFMTTLFYGDMSRDAESINGFEQRYNDPSAANGRNIIDGASGADWSAKTDLRSIYFVCWADNKCTGIVPKSDTDVGLISEDWGENLLPDDGSGTNARIKVYQTYFKWNVGLHIADWRYVVRIANISVGEITKDAATGPNLPDLMFDALSTLPDMDGRCSFYMSQDVVRGLRKQISNGVSNSTLTVEDVGGISWKKRLMFDGIPVAVTDGLNRMTDDGTPTGNTVYNPDQGSAAGEAFVTF